MKKIYTTIALMPIMAVLGFLFIIYNSPQPHKIKDTGEDAFVKERVIWENLRLRDPYTGKVPRNINAKANAFVNDLRQNFKLKDRFLSNEWTRRGPYEIGGRTRALALDVLDENIIIAGAVSGGMWRSIDGGQTWTETTKPDQLKSISCVAQDTREGKENIWYAGTGEFWGNSADLNGNGIYKSTDGGQSWSLIESTTTGTPGAWDGAFEYVWEIKTNPAAPAEVDEILASTALGGVYRSTDGGETWNAVLGGYGNNYSYFTDVEITQNGVYYATLSTASSQLSGSIEYGIYRSTDGENWTNITPEDFPKNYKRIVIGVAPSDENQVYFLSESPGYGKWTTNSRGDDLWHSIWKYTYIGGDGAGENGTWEDRSESIPKPELTRGQFNSQGSYNLCIAVKPDDPETVFIGGVALYRSDDGWKSGEFTWIGGTCYDDDCEYFYRYPNHHADNHTLTFLPSDPTILFSGSDGGVHKTINNKAERMEWISLNNGYFTTQYYTIAIDHGDNLSEEILGGLQDNGTLLSRENILTKEWETPSRADGFYCAIPDGGEFYYTSQNSSNQPKIKIWRIVQNEDGTNKWKTRLDPIGGKDFIWNTPFLLDPNNNNIMYVAGGNMVWRNNDLSAIPFVNSTDSIAINWDSLSNTKLNEIPQGTRPEAVSALAISKEPANVLYYGSTFGKVFRVDNANEGNPEPINITDDKFPPGYVSSIVVDPENAMEAIISFSNYNILSIFHTTDGGESWNAISGNLEDQPNGKGNGPAVLWTEILKVGNERFYLAGTSAGLFTTAYVNEMNTIWKQQSTDLIGNTVIDMIDVRQKDGFVAIGTHGTGVYTTYIKTLPEKPGGVSLVYPENEINNFRDEGLFKWTEYTDELVSYRLQFSKDQNFDNIEIEVSGISADSAIATGFEQGYQTYYWRVQTVGNGGLGEYSDVRSFTTGIAVPELTYPPNESEEVPISPSFVWNEVEDAIQYHFQITKTGSFNNTLIDTVLSGNGFKMYDLQAFVTHTWRVAAIDEKNGTGVFSEPFKFKVDRFNSVSTSIENNIKLYPNPAKSIVNFEMKNIQPGLIQIDLIDQTGKVVKSLMNEYNMDSAIDLQFNIQNLSSGSYFIKINNGNHSHSKVLLLTK